MLKMEKLASDQGIREKRTQKNGRTILSAHCAHCSLMTQSWRQLRRFKCAPFGFRYKII